MLAFLLSCENLILAQEIVTRSTIPRRHEIKVADLPPPNQKASVTNRPKTAKAPARPVLAAPAGFRVAVFVSDIEGARWLALTPTGDVLVTRKRGDDVTLLRDINWDGAADERKRFGGKQNGLNQPFGIALHDDAVFIANTIASGVRNPTGLAFHPRSEEPYVVVNERDKLGDNLVRDYFTRLQDGGFYGCPTRIFGPTCSIRTT